MINNFNLLYILSFISEIILLALQNIFIGIIIPTFSLLQHYSFDSTAAMEFHGTVPFN